MNINHLGELAFTSWKGNRSFRPKGVSPELKVGSPGIKGDSPELKVGSPGLSTFVEHDMKD